MARFELWAKRTGFATATSGAMPRLDSCAAVPSGSRQVERNAGTPWRVKRNKRRSCCG
jgi:hypothetical protein